MGVDDAFSVVSGELVGDRSRALDVLAGHVEETFDLLYEAGVACHWLLSSGLVQQDVDEVMDRLGV